MSALAFVWWAIAATGLVQIVTRSSFFTPIRSFLSLRSRFLASVLVCPMCFGFWAGLVGAAFVTSPAWHLVGPDAIGGGMLGSMAPGWPRWGLRGLYRVFLAVLDGCAVSWLAWAWEGTRLAIDRSGVVRTAPAAAPAPPPDAQPHWLDSLPYDDSPPTIALAGPPDDDDGDVSPMVSSRLVEWQARAAAAVARGEGCSDCAARAAAAAASPST